MIDKKEYVISKQLLRCGTSVGANVEEAIAAQSRNDFISKMSIALKERRETNYWLRLLKESGYVELDFTDILKESGEVNNIIAAIIRTTKENTFANSR